MADGQSTAAEPRPGESSRHDQEKVGTENATENGTRHQPSELPAQQQQQQESEKPSSPPLPPRPLPPALEETRKQQRLPPLPPQGVHFGPLPLEEPYAEADDDFVRPRSPGWQKVSVVLGCLSLISSAVILAIGIACGFLNAPYNPYTDSPVDIIFGVCGTAAGLSIVVTALDFLKTWRSRRTQGLHPGLLVACHLIIWLVGVVAVALTAVLHDTWSGDWYDYPRETEWQLASKNSTYEVIMLGFTCALVFFHFVMFVGACVETNRLERAKKRVVVVQVPVPADAMYHPGAQYPAYGPPQAFMPHPGAQPGQGAGSLPAQPPPAAYGGYYAPAPQDAAWTAAAQQQRNSGVQWQGYYAPAPAPARHSMRGPPAPALATSSGSRRSQRRAQEQTEQQVQATAPATESENK